MNEVLCLSASLSIFLCTNLFLLAFANSHPFDLANHITAFLMFHLSRFFQIPIAETFPKMLCYCFNMHFNKILFNQAEILKLWFLVLFVCTVIQVQILFGLYFKIQTNSSFCQHAPHWNFQILPIQVSFVILLYLQSNPKFEISFFWFMSSLAVPINLY